MKYITIHKDQESKKIEADRLQRFLDAGWTEKTSNTSTKKTSKRKLKIAEPEVKQSTQLSNEDLIEQIKHSEMDLEEDNWTYSEDDFKNNNEEK